MAFSWRWWLVIAVLLGAMMLAACGGDDEGPSANGPTDEGVATTQPADDAVVDEEGEEDGDGEDGGGVEAGGDAFDDVPVPEGARETGSGEWSGSIPGMIPGQGAEPGDYSTIEYKEYEVDDSPSDIIDFFQAEMTDWEEGFVFSGGEDGDEGGVGVWIRDDGEEAVWVTASSSNGGSDLVVIRGSAD